MDRFLLSACDPCGGYFELCIACSLTRCSDYDDRCASKKYEIQCMLMSDLGKTWRIEDQPPQKEQFKSRLMKREGTSTSPSINRLTTVKAHLLQWNFVKRRLMLSITSMSRRCFTTLQGLDQKYFNHSHFHQSFAICMLKYKLELSTWRVISNLRKYPILCGHPLLCALSQDPMWWIHCLIKPC